MRWLAVEIPRIRGTAAYSLSVTDFPRLLSCGVLTAALLLTAGCGDDEPKGSATDPTSAPTTPTSTSTSGLPDCETLWVDGGTLPQQYAGCTDATGAEVKADKHPCSYGGAIVEYDGRFYALTGKRINETPSLEQSKQYQGALSACQA